VVVNKKLRHEQLLVKDKDVWGDAHEFKGVGVIENIVSVFAAIDGRLGFRFKVDQFCFYKIKVIAMSGFYKRRIFFKVIFLIIV